MCVCVHVCMRVRECVFVCVRVHECVCVRAFFSCVLTGGQCNYPQNSCEIPTNPQSNLNYKSVVTSFEGRNLLKKELVSVSTVKECNYKPNACRLA